MLLRKQVFEKELNPQYIENDDHQELTRSVCVYVTRRLVKGFTNNMSSIQSREGQSHTFVGEIHVYSETNF